MLPIFVPLPGVSVTLFIAVLAVFACHLFMVPEAGARRKAGEPLP